MAKKLILKTKTEGNINVLASLCSLKFNKTSNDTGSLILEIPIDNNGLSVIDSKPTEDSITLSFLDEVSNKIHLADVEVQFHLDPSGEMVVTLNGIDTKIGSNTGK